MKKIAIVTGASSGLGMDFVRQLDIKYNLDEIWMVARRKEKMIKISRNLKRSKGIIIEADLSRIKEIHKISDKLKKERPKVLFLVNSAGFGKIGAFDDIPLEDQLKMIDVNVKGLTAVTYEVIPYLIKGSKIIQIASSAAFLPQPGFNIYAATKAFVLHFSKALRAELKNKKVNVLAVCPGPVKTEFFNVASSKGKPLDWKSKFMVKSKDVVSQALKDSEENKIESIYGGIMKTFKIVSRIIPDRFILKLFRWN